MFKVHVGYTTAGRNRWKRFSTLAGACRYCELVFGRTGVVLTVEAA